MIVTIDGPAGAGKSTGARALAERLGFEFLDTGAMYRAVALAAHRAATNPADETQVANLLKTLRLQMPPGRVLLNGEDISAMIRTTKITQLSRAIADSPNVRQRLGELQREMASGRNIVCEGRDQGTVVFPDAECKFFLMASPEERARRRQQEMMDRGEEISFDQVLHMQQERDARDAARELAPMKPARDALVVDSTSLSAVELVDLLEKRVRAVAEFARIQGD